MAALGCRLPGGTGWVPRDEWGRMGSLGLGLNAKCDPSQKDPRSQHHTWDSRQCHALWDRQLGLIGHKKNKFRRVSFKDLRGCVGEFGNRAAPHLARTNTF